MHRVGGASPCPFPRPTAGSGGGAASPPASPGGGAWFGKIFVSHKNKTSARPFPHDRAGAGVPQAAWEGVRAQEQVAARQLSLRPARLAGLPTRPRAGACVSDGGGGGRGHPGLPRGPRGDGPGCSETPAHPPSGYCLSFGQVESKGNQNGKTKNTKVRSRSRRCERARGRAPHPHPAAPQPAARSQAARADRHVLHMSGLCLLPDTCCSPLEDRAAPHPEGAGPGAGGRGRRAWSGRHSDPEPGSHQPEGGSGGGGGGG